MQCYIVQHISSRQLIEPDDIERRYRIIDGENIVGLSCTAKFGRYEQIKCNGIPCSLCSSDTRNFKYHMEIK